MEGVHGKKYRGQVHQGHQARTANLPLQRLPRDMALAGQETDPLSPLLTEAAMKRIILLAWWFAAIGWSIQNIGPFPDEATCESRRVQLEARTFLETIDCWSDQGARHDH